MTFSLIYHPTDGSATESPFEKAIDTIAEGSQLFIACPYISVDYLKSLTKLRDSWQLVTDINAWLGSTPKSQRVDACKFMLENSRYIRNCPLIHAKVVLSEKSALIGSSNMTEYGIKKRTEMGIMIEGESLLTELKGWFDEIWEASHEVPPEKTLTDLSESLPEREFLSTEKAGLFPKSVSVSHTWGELLKDPHLSPYLPPKPTEPYEGIEYDIIDAIIGAYTWNEEDNWLRSNDQIEKLGNAQDATLDDGRKAFPCMQKYDGKSRTNRINQHSDKMVHKNKEERKHKFGLAKGVKPSDLGVSQDLVDALAAYGVIPRYNVNSSNHDS